MDSINSNDLSYYLNRIHKFLIGDEETIRFRYLSAAAEKILMKIAMDTEILKNEHIDDDCKSKANQIADVLEQNVHNFTLKYVFEKNEQGEREMVYQKMPVVSKELKPLRKPNIIQASVTDDEVPVKGTVMLSFKTRCLNATLKFVKCDHQLVLQYPNMTSEQADFLREMISQCMTPSGMDVGFGFKGLYAPLADALKAVGLKYHLKLSRVPTDSDMQRWKFEKHPIGQKYANDDIQIIERSNSTENQTCSQDAHKPRNTDLTGSKIAQKSKNNSEPSNSTEAQTCSQDAHKPTNIDLTGSENAQKPKNNDLTGPQNAQILETIDLTGPESAQTIRNLYDRTKPVKPLQVSTKNSQKLKYENGSVAPSQNLKNIDNLIEVCKTMTGTFKKTSLLRLRDFLLDEMQDQLVFNDMTSPGMVFLTHWRVVISRVEIIGMFGVEGQMTLDEIRHLVDVNANRFTVKLRMNNFRKEGAEKLRDIIFVKIFATDKKPKRDSSVSSTNSLKMTKEVLKFLKQIKNVDAESMEYSLLRLEEFLTDDAQASLAFPKPHVSMETFLNSVLELKEPLAAKIFSSEMFRLWRNILLLLDKNAKKYTVKKVRPDGMGLRDFTFRKEPSFGHSSATSSSANTKQTNKTACFENTERSADSQIRKVKALEALYFASQPKTVQSKPIQQTGSIPRKITNNTWRDVESSVRVIPPVSKTSVRVTSLPDNTRVVTLEGKRSKVNTAKAKIIEAMQQPLVSEKGAKMMRLMGWGGGALGLRGDGIVEPIIPSLDMANRAGLGLPKPQKMTIPLITELPSPTTRVELPVMPAKKEFKRGVLETVLKMLTTENGVYELMFPHSLTEKKWAFVRRFVSMFNLKSKVNAEDKQHKKITLDIMNLMMGTDYIITACFGTMRRKILLVLCKGIYVPSPNDWCDVANLDHIQKHIILPREIPGQRAKVAIYNDCGPNTNKNTASANKNTNNNDTSANNANKGKVGVKDAMKSHNVDAEGAKKTANHDSAKDSDSNERAKDTKNTGLKDGKQTYVNDKDRKNTMVTNTTKESDDNKAEYGAIETENERNIETLSIIDLTEDDSQDDIMTNAAAFKCYIIKEILEFCKDVSTDYKIQVGNEKLIIEKEINLNFEMNKQQITCVKNLIKRFKKQSQIQHDSTDMSLFDEMVSLMKGYILEALFPPEKVVPTEPTAVPIHKKIIFRKVFISTMSKNFYLFKSNLSNATTSKLADSINEISPNVISSNKTSKITNNAMPNIGTNAQDIVKGKTDISANVAENVNKKNNNIKAVNRRTTFTSDTVDEKCMFDYGNAKTKDVDAKFKQNDNISEPELNDNNTQQNKTEHVKRRTTFTSDKFDEKCMFDYGLQQKQKSEPGNKETCNLKHISVVDKCLCGSRDSDVQIMEDKRDTVEINDEQEVEYIVIEKESVDFIDCLETDKSVTEKQSDVVKNVGVHPNKTNVNMLKVLKRSVSKNIADDLLTQDSTKEHKETDSFTFNGENGNIQKVTNETRKTQNNETADKVGKRRSIYEPTEGPIKKCKYEEFKKEITIIPKNYPQTKIDKKMAGQIQKSILSSIDYKQELPLLKCLGIQNGALSYCCRTEESYNSLEKLVKSLEDFEITVKEETENTRYVMAFRINTFFDEKVDDIFKRLVSFNTGLVTKEWIVMKKEEYSDYIVIQVELDELSYKYIRDAKFSLHAGIDEAVFSMAW